MITYTALNVMHKVIATKTPEALYSLLTSNMHTHNTWLHTCKLHMKHKSITDQLASTFMYKTLSIYNTLPQTLVGLNSQTFSTRVKLFVKGNFAPNSIPECIT